MDGVEKGSSREQIFMKRERGSDDDHFVERRSMFQAWTDCGSAPSSRGPFPTHSSF